MKEFIFVWASILILLSPLSISSQTVSSDTSQIAEEILIQKGQIDSLRKEIEKLKEDNYEKAMESAKRSISIATLVIALVALIVGIVGIFGYFRIREIKADYDKTERDLRESLREIKADYKETKAELMRRFEEDLEKVKEYKEDIKEIYEDIKEKRKLAERDTRKIEEFKKNIEAQEKEVPSDFSKEVSELIKKDSKRAIEDYENVTNEIFGESVYLTMAYNYYVEKQYDDSIGELKKVIKLNPKRYDAYNNWGVALGELGKYEEAIEKYRKATELKPDYADVYSNWCVALAQLGRYDEAIEKGKKAIALKPDYASAWYNIACAYSLQNKKTEALENLKRAIELDPAFKEKAKKDEDFKNLWEDEDFKKLVG